MERRFVIFLVLTLLVWTGFLALRSVIAPPPPPVAKQEPSKPAAEKADQAGKKDQADGKAAPDAAASAPQAAAQQPGAADSPAEVPAPAVLAPHKLLSIGSLDPASGYALLVTADSRGAAIRRVELSSPRFKSVEDHSGYLGHLELEDAGSSGARVRVVGAGTPAALAAAEGGHAVGLRAGDILLAIDAERVSGAYSVENYLQAKTRPGQNVALEVRREGAAAPLKFRATLTRRPVEVVRPEAHEYDLPGGGHVVLPTDPLSLLLTLDHIGGRTLRGGEVEFTGLPSLRDANWSLEQHGPDFVEFSFTLDDAALQKLGKSGSLKIRKRYSLAKAGPDGRPAQHVDLKISIENLGAGPQTVGYRLEGPTGLPLEGWWYSNKLHPRFGYATGARDVAYYQTGLGHNLLGGPAIVSQTKELREDKKPEQISLLTGDQASPFEYVGVDTQFFAAAALPQPLAGEQPIKFRAAWAMAVQDVTQIPKSRLRTANVSFALAAAPQELAAGQTLAHEYKVFFGPKDPRILAQYGLSSLIEYGWKIFAYPALLLLMVLNGLHWLTAAVGIPNYGIAIILLTVIVRTCMIPISLKQARSAAKMQELAPEIQRIKEKFPDDPMKQHAAVQELYKKHDFNMFSGCLPVFIQLPIFIGLYRCLSVDIDLRDASLIPGLSWASNLAGPDKLFYWRDYVFSIIGDEADGWLGPYFNVLPLITVALFLVQQKMFTPPATDEQTQMQQQMMTYMTVFMGVMFYKVPAGLCLYFITSSLWGICERKLLPKSASKSTSSPPSDAGGGGGGGGWLGALSPKPAPVNGAGRGTSPRKRQKR